MGGASCKAKVILNGGAVRDVATRLCYMVDETEYASLTDEQWKAIIKHLNIAEDAMDKAERAFLDGLGFDGPWPNRLK